MTGLLGSNGAGKTTLIGMILGLHRPDEDTSSGVDLDPSHAGPEVRARIGYSPEHHRLPPDMRVSDFVAHVAQIHGLPKRAAINRASDALWHVGLGEERFRHSAPCRPASASAPSSRRRSRTTRRCSCSTNRPTAWTRCSANDMLHLIKRIGHDFGIHIVLSSHLLEEVEQVCDGVVILRDGLVGASGSLEAVRGTTQGVVVELLGAPETSRRSWTGCAAGRPSNSTGCAT